MPNADFFWTELFPAVTGNRRQERRLRVVSKKRRPLLLIPERPAAAAVCLELYPAQRRAARYLRKLLQISFRLGCYPGCPALDLWIATESPLVGFLSTAARMPRGSLPEFGVLAGNSATEGRRYLMLLFNAEGRPEAVAKVGIGKTAQDLIQREASFLQTCAGAKPGVPRLRERLQDPQAMGLALDYFHGPSPAPGMNPGIGPLLQSWIHPKERVPLGALARIQALTAAVSADSVWPKLARDLQGREAASVLFHGDFAPWNIRLGAGANWQVLDWERGEMAGPPAWDWYHYLVQTGILVERMTAGDLLARIRQLWAAPAFRDYAGACAIQDLEAALFEAYLLHVIYVLRPSEGLPAARELLSALRQMSQSTR